WKGVKRAAFDRVGDVERQSAFWRNEEVVDREIVTAGAAESGHPPSVEDPYFRCSQRDLQQFGSAARTHHGLPALAEQRAYQHHIGMLAPATEFPATRDSIASVTFLDPPGRTERPGDDRTRNRSDKVSRGAPEKPRPQIGVEHDHDVPAAGAV